MKILGIELSKPSFNEVTASAVMAAGLWLAIMALMRVSEQPLDRVDAGAALLVIFWGCVGVRLGIRFDKGLRHVAANVLGGGAILVIYHAVMALLGSGRQARFESGIVSVDCYISARRTGE